MTPNLVSTAWLAEHIHAEDIVVIDASWHLPTAKRDARVEHEAAHIPGAVFYDLDAGSERNSTLPHMLPSAEKFAADMGALGVGTDSHVIVYDSVGLFSAARLWWMLKSFSHQQVSVLDGGLKKWMAEGRKVEIAVSTVSIRYMSAALDERRVRSRVDVAQALSTGKAQIADARSPTRFRGEEPEPRPGVRPGHMPGAFNLHYATLLNADGTLKAKPDLRRAIEAAGIDLKRPIIASCGSGITAAVIILALEELGITEHGLFDGSWAEWGASDEMVVTG